MQNCLGIIQFLFYFLKVQIKIPSLFQCFPESRGCSYNESKMNIYEFISECRYHKSTPLCGALSANTVLVVFPLEILYLWYFFQWKIYYCGITEEMLAGVV